LIYLAILIGLVWGSFLSVVITRIDNLGTIFFGRSNCPKCKKTLGALDLVPLVSYIAFGGKCRHCKGAIGLKYPLLELLSAALFGTTVILFPLSWPLVFLVISLSALIVAVFVDAESMEVDLWLFVVGVISGSFWLFSHSGWNLVTSSSYLWGILSAILIPFCFYMVSREKWMGLGDVFFALWAGCILGFPRSIIAIFAAFLIGALFGIIYLVVKRKTAGVKIAFGPFVGLGTVVALFWGDKLVQIYLKLLGF